MIIFIRRLMSDIPWINCAFRYLSLVLVVEIAHVEDFSIFNLGLGLEKHGKGVKGAHGAGEDVFELYLISDCNDWLLSVIFEARLYTLVD